MSNETEKLRQLTKSEEYKWEKMHEKELERIKDLLTRNPVLRCYDPSEPTSSSGLCTNTGTMASMLCFENTIEERNQLRTNRKRDLQFYLHAASLTSTYVENMM